MANQPISINRKRKKIKKETQEIVKPITRKYKKDVLCIQNCITINTKTGYKYLEFNDEKES